MIKNNLNLKLSQLKGEGIRGPTDWQKWLSIGSDSCAVVSKTCSLKMAVIKWKSEQIEGNTNILSERESHFCGTSAQISKTRRGITIEDMNYLKNIEMKSQ